MIALVLLVSWMLVITLVVGLCAAARRGDQAQAEGGQQVPTGLPATARPGAAERGGALPEVPAVGEGAAARRPQYAGRERPGERIAA